MSPGVFFLTFISTVSKEKKSGSAKIRAKFETLRREIKADIRKQHDLYVNNMVGDVKANPKYFTGTSIVRKRTPLKKRNGGGVFGDIVWPDRLNKSGSPLSPSEGEILIEIMNDYGLEQLVHFPTRERNTWDLIITSLPGQFVDIHSPDRLSDHDIVSGTLKMVIPPH